MLLRSVLLSFIRQDSVLNIQRVSFCLPKVLCNLKGFVNYGLITIDRNAHTRRHVSITERKDFDNETKAKLVKKLNFISKEDALPFYKLPFRTLLHVQKVTQNDVLNGYCANRLYFIAHKIKCPPSKLSECLAQRIFIYSLSFDWIESSLNVLLEMGVAGDRIIRDLWVLKYHHETIRERLQKVKDLGVDTLYPWMVRCNEDILNRFITISRDTKKILGDTMSTQVYLANRLNTTPEAVEDMCVRIPALKTIRVTKVKKFLDFLIKEGFEVQDIANKPRVLTASQKTVEQRLNKLRKLGLSEINLNVLCRSRKDFKKYCDSIGSLAISNPET
ncbi:transcription termination factor, mitochondrial [Hyposmocoma kahamanoa]|uniref:transcription termination factor, mitochondrial n=1 Tax=Hyposmocoma kahamanoa TaxID=1477025 RepID=UPI000E6D69DE|nr:transcription termination factor, mitochondrial [Hyposmocoma kahamanoa]